MKLQLTPEQKKWTMTLCLLATLGFNLSHLVDQPVAGQGEFSSYAEDVDRADQEEGEAIRANQAAAEAKKQQAGSATRSAAVPLAPITDKAAQLAEEKRLQNLASNTSGGSTQPAAKPTPPTSNAVKKESIEVEVQAGKKIKFEYEAAGSRIFVTTKDPNMATTDAGACSDPEMRCYNKYVEVGSHNSKEAIMAAIAEAYTKKIAAAAAANTAAAKTEPADACALEYEKMNTTQKSKCSDQKFSELEKSLDSCSSSSTSSNASERQVTCSVEKLKAFLNDSENRRFVNDEKAAEFFDNHIRGNLKSALAASLSSKDRRSAANLVDKLQRSLPGSYKLTRESIISASAESVKEGSESLRELNRTAQEIQTEFQRLARNRNCDVDCLEAMQDLRVQYFKTIGEVQTLKSNLRNGRTTIRNKNNDGLKWAVSKYRGEGLTELVRTQLLANYDRLSYLNLDGSEMSGRGVPVRTRTAGDEANLTNGVRVLRSSKLVYPSGIRSGTANRNGSRVAPVINNTIPATQPQIWGQRTSLIPANNRLGSQPIQGY